MNKLRCEKSREDLSHGRDIERDGRVKKNLRNKSLSSKVGELLLLSHMN